MEVSYNYNELEFTAYYDEDGYLKFVKDNIHNKALMIESIQEGKGFNISKSSFMMDGFTCHGMYVRVMDINLFIPKFIFIKNKTD